MPRPASPPKPLRMSQSRAAVVLACSPRHVRQLQSAGVLTAVRPSGVIGRGRRCYLLTDEIELYAEGRMDELAALVSARRRRSK